MEDIVDAVENFIPNLFRECCRNEKIMKTFSDIFDQPLKFDFKQKHTLEERESIYNELFAKCPRKIPVIVEFGNKNKKTLKFLMDYDERISTLLCKIRTNYKISNTDSIFLMSENNALLMSSQRIGDAYKENLFQHGHKEDFDKIYYLMVYHENTFG